MKREDVLLDAYKTDALDRQAWLGSHKLYIEIKNRDGSDVKSGYVEWIAYQTGAWVCGVKRSPGFHDEHDFPTFQEAVDFSMERHELKP